MIQIAPLFDWVPRCAGRPFEQVHDSERQWIVRPDHRKVGSLFLGQRQQSRQVFGSGVDAFDRRLIFYEAFFCDARIARRTPHLSDVGRLRELPNEGVLTPA